MSTEFMKISPGHKIPAIVDHGGPRGVTVTVFESGAILKYLAEKSHKFYPSDADARANVDQWLFYGSATFTTLSRQFGHWTIRSQVKAPTAQQFYEANLCDMLDILDHHLALNEYFCGAYSIADMSMYSDVHLHGVNDIGLEDYSNLERWHDAIESSSAASVGTVSYVNYRKLFASFPGTRWTPTFAPEASIAAGFAERGFWNGVRAQYSSGPTKKPAMNRCQRIDCRTYI